MGSRPKWFHSALSEAPVTLPELSMDVFPTGHHPRSGQVRHGTADPDPDRGLLKPSILMRMNMDTKVNSLNLIHAVQEVLRCFAVGYPCCFDLGDLKLDQLFYKSPGHQKGIRRLGGL